MSGMKEKNTVPKDDTYNNDREKTITDKYSAIYILFYAFGITFQLHNHFFITANHYWMYKFRDPESSSSDSEDRTPLQARFTSLCSTVSSVSSLLFVVIAMVSAKWISIQKRIISSLVLFVSMFTFTLVFVLVDTDAWQKGFFVVTLASLCFITAAGGFIALSAVELSTRFPPEYFPAILSGQAVCGIMSSLIQIISLSVVSSSTLNGTVYFSIGLLFVIVTTVSYFFISQKNEFFKKHYKNKPEPIKKDQINMALFKSAFNKIKWYNIAMLITLGSTVIVHPSITTLVVSTNEGNGGGWENIYFVPVVTFLLQHVFDLIGRELAVKIKLPDKDLVILAISILRIAFVPLLMYCNAQPRSNLPVLFGDLSYIGLVAVFSFTSGYLVTICTYHMPRQTPDPVEKLVAYIFISIGVLIGTGIFSFMGVLLISSL